MLRRDAAAIYSEEDLKEKLAGGRKLRVKFGADCSRPDLHLGHSVPLRKLRMLQEMGHEIVFVIGDFTGMIGDPTGRSSARRPLTFEETRENGRTYFEQVTRILDAIAYNSQWLAKMNFADVLRLAGKYTLARILERDDFAKRFAANRPIGLHETLYPLMQGYDSVALHADIEIGGTDQTFNLLVGRELQKDYGQEPQAAVTFPILPGLDGAEKMSKSLGNTIGISEPPDMMFEKCMRVQDGVLGDYFRLTTDVPAARYEPLIREDIRKAHLLYAENIVAFYHNTGAAREAEDRYLAVASGAAPDNMAEVAVTCGEISIVELVKAAGFAASNSEARRLIRGGGIRLDGRTVTDEGLTVGGVKEAVVGKGKNGFTKVIFR